MGIIEELWYGNIAPNELSLKQGRYKELLGEVVRCEKDLGERLNDEENVIFDKFTELMSEMYGIAEREAFARGFVLGARIIIEVMNTEIE